MREEMLPQGGRHQFGVEVCGVAMAIAVEHSFARMIEWDIKSVIMQCPWLCHWRLPSTGDQEADFIVAVYGAAEDWTSETEIARVHLPTLNN